MSLFSILIFFLLITYVSSHFYQKCYCIDETSEGCNECNTHCFKELKDCRECPQHCKECTKSTDCLKCEDGMIWNGTHCRNCPENCVQCDENKCIKCEEGFYQSNGLCFHCDEKCLTCSNELNCEECFYLKDTIENEKGECIECENVIQNCISCKMIEISVDSQSSSTPKTETSIIINNNNNNNNNNQQEQKQIIKQKECTLCRMGYYVDEKKTCSQCNNLCGKSGCDKNGCFDCVDNYILHPINRTCLPQNENHCSRSSNGKCVECDISQNEYFLLNGWCYPIKSCDNKTLSIPSESTSTEKKCISIENTHCLMINKENKTCGVCTPNSQNKNGLCYLNQTFIDHCLQTKYHMDMTICSVCEYGYFPMDNRCIATSLIDFCYVMMNTMNSYEPSSTRCLQCKDELNSVVTSRFQCRNDPHCRKYSNELCIHCENNFLLKNLKCVSATEFNCEESDGFICLKCKEGYMLSDNYTCFSIPVQHCHEYQTKNDCCTKCDEGFMLESCNCKNCSINHCEICSQTKEITCDKCQKGYYLNENKCISCSSIDINCDECNLNECLHCSNNHYLNNTKCENCSTLFPGCSQCNGSTCFQCNSAEYLLKENECKKCNTLYNSHCLECNEFRCHTCEKGFYLDGEECLPCETLKGCKECHQQFPWCLTCDKQYKLNTLSHYCENCEEHTRGCKQCNDELVCNECKDNELTKNLQLYNKCYISQNHCLKLIENTICIECENGYVLRNGNCLQYNSSEECLKYSQESHSFGCEQCKNGISLTGNCKDIENLFDESSDYINTNIATLDYKMSKLYSEDYENCNDDNCLFCFEENECFQCTQGFIVNETFRCEKISNCNSTSSTHCKHCDDGYYLFHKTCFECDISNCVLCEHNGNHASDANGYCLKCEKDYILYQNQCIHKSSFHCQFVNDSHCEICEQLYFLSNDGFCKPNTIQDCLYQSDENTCQQCKSGNLIITLDGKTYCSSTDHTPNCQIESSKGCALCNKGFTHYKSTCVRCKSNCARCTYGNAVCSECFPGYFYDEFREMCLPLASRDGCLHYLQIKKDVVFVKKVFFIIEQLMNVFHVIHHVQNVKTLQIIVLNVQKVIIDQMMEHVNQLLISNIVKNYIMINV